MNDEKSEQKTKRLTMTMIKNNEQWWAVVKSWWKDTEKIESWKDERWKEYVRRCHCKRVQNVLLKVKKHENDDGEQHEKCVLKEKVETMITMKKHEKSYMEEK